MSEAVDIGEVAPKTTQIRIRSISTLEPTNQAADPNASNKSTEDFSIPRHLAIQQIPDLPSDFHHRDPLSYEEFERISTILRPLDSEPAVVELPQDQEDIVPFIKELLESLGYDASSFFVRKINPDRLDQAIKTGSDRDHESLLDNKRLGNDQAQAMIENGLNPKTDRGLVTYAFSYSDLSPVSIPTDPSNPRAVLVYHPDTLEYINPKGRTLNGFAAFKDPRLIQRSLLAVLVPKS